MQAAKQDKGKKRAAESESDDESFLSTSSDESGASESDVSGAESGDELSALIQEHQEHGTGDYEPGLRSGKEKKPAVYKKKAGESSGAKKAQSLSKARSPSPTKKQRP